VAASLLKQLVRSVNRLPSSLEKIYDDEKKERRAPTLSSLVDLFIIHPKQASCVVLFDAFDECGEQGLVYSQLIQRFHSEGIKVFITHRPHVIKSPEIDFGDFTRMEIRARDEDVGIHIRGQLALHEKAKRFENTFRDRIINAIMLKANGMYIFQ
jgi:hypothetical protein